MKSVSNLVSKANTGSMFFPNMNILRYLLSFGILINHYNVLTGHDVPYFLWHDRIGAFFVLSGFLMYHSYSKISDVGKFAVHRARRILPTYFFIVLLCAFGGVLISSLSFTQYFGSSGFWEYLGANLSFMNWLAPTLPGVFEDPVFLENTVNGSLWTMKVELVLDLSVPLFVYIVARTGWRKEFTAIGIIIISMISRFFFLNLYEETGNNLYAILSRQFFGQASFFYAGMLAYFLLDRVIKHKMWLIFAGLILYVVGPNIPLGNVIIAPVSVCMLAIGISVTGYTIKPFIHLNCISYNIFLLHFPVIQVLVLFGLNQYPVWISLGTVILVTVTLAWLTNKYIDSLFVRKRSYQRS